MGKRGRILIAVVAIIVTGVVGWSIFREWSAPPEPMYKGKPLSYWLRGYVFAPYGTNPPNRMDAEAAMREAGTNAIPLLLRMLETRDSALKIQMVRWAYSIPYVRNHYAWQGPKDAEAVMGFLALEQKAAPAVPDLVKILNENSNTNSKVKPLIILGRIGPPAADAVPTLLSIAAGTNKSARNAALNALGQIHCDPDTVVPVLITALHDPSATVRADAAGGLANFGTNARPAVPLLVEIISEPEGSSNWMPVYPGVRAPQNTTVRDIAKLALKAIDPETYSILVTNVLPVPTWK